MIEISLLEGLPIAFCAENVFFTIFSAIVVGVAGIVAGGVGVLCAIDYTAEPVIARVKMPSGQVWFEVFDTEECQNRYKYQITVYSVCSVVQPMIVVKGDKEVDLIRTLSKSDENGNPTTKDIVGAIAKLKRNFKAYLIEANRQGLLYEVRSDKKALDAFSPSISSRFKSIDIVEQPADSDGPLCSVSFRY